MSSCIIIFLTCVTFACGKTLNNSSALTAADASENANDGHEICDNYIVENEFVLLENGSLLLPSSDAVYEYHTYFIENGTAFVCVEKPSQMAGNSQSHSMYDWSQEFLSCVKIFLEPDEYEQLKNGSIYIDVYNQVLGPRDYYMKEDGAYVCLPRFDEMPKSRPNITHPTHLNKFPESFGYVTYVGLLLSIISLLAHLIVFCVVSSVRNLPGCCLASLSLSLLLAYSCFLLVEVVKPTNHCANLGASLYYFFLTSFFWMNILAFDVWRSFRVVMRELRISSHRVPWRRFLLYSLYSWLVPAVLTALVKVADSSDLLPVDYRPSFGSPACWFGQRKALLVFFAVPLCAIMFLNAVFFLDVTYVISRATLKTTQTHEATLKKRFFTFMRLALIMGLTWIVGLVAGYADIVFLWYVFIILNTLQGLFIFIVFSCSSKVRSLFFKKYKKHSKARGSTSVRTISQISAAL